LREGRGKEMIWVVCTWWVDERVEMWLKKWVLKEEGDGRQKEGVVSGEWRESEEA